MADPWDKEWTELADDERAAVKALGYDEEHWMDRFTKSPDACCKTWELLSEAQQRAAAQLGYHQAKWDEEYEGGTYYEEPDEALWRAAEASDAEAVRRAVARSPSLDGMHGGEYSWKTTLHLSCGGGDLDVVQVLLAARADVNATNVEGATPLLNASFQGHVEVARALLEAGADPAAKDTFGTTAMDKARNGASYEVIALLEAALPASAGREAAGSSDFDGDILTARGRIAVAGAAVVVSAALVAALLAVRRKL